MDLRNCSDEELVKRFLRNEQSAEAFGILLERMQPVLHARVNSALRRANSNIVRDDLLQEAMMAFLSAITAYQVGRGASLRTFVSVCVSNRLTSTLRKQTPEQEQLLESALPPGYASMDPQDLYAATEDARRVQDVIQSKLTPLERNVLQAHMEHQDYRTIAQCLEVSGKTVDNALQRARKKLQRYL